MYVPILKERKECYLTGSKKNLTYHHIIPKRDIEYNNDENILILNRKTHNIIDCKKIKRTKRFYLKNKELIDKYNNYLKKNNFDRRHFWRVSKHKRKKKFSLEEIKEKIKSNQKTSKQYKRYILKKELKKSKLIPKKKSGLTPLGKRKLLEGI